VGGLERAKPRGIRRTHIDDEKVSIGIKYLEDLPIVSVSFFKGSIFILADIDANDNFCWTIFQVFGDLMGPGAIEAHAVEEGVIPGNAEKAGSGVARLGPGRYGAYFYKSKT
jgi:hypothetical protein